MLPWEFRAKAKAAAKIEREKNERLAKAEEDLRGFQARAQRAIDILDDRRRRNHWRESIEKMIQGA